MLCIVTLRMRIQIVKGTRGFNSEAFYKWVESQPYQVFFSSYRLNGVSDGLYEVWNKEKQVTFNENKLYKTEVIYIL